MRKVLLFASACLAAVTLQARPFMVVAYNVENLHDVDGVAQFEEYQPANYTRAHALTKFTNVAKAVAMFEGGRGPDVLILCELEVDFTPAKAPLDFEAMLARYAGTTLAEMLGPKFDAAVGDLPAEALLLKAFADRGLTGYHVVVPDAVHTLNNSRQLEQKCVIFSRFPVTATKAHVTTDARPILEAQLDVDGAPLYVFANHWKSGASDDATEATRVANAKTLRTRLDEILKADPNADIVLGGDFNSQYNQRQRYTNMKVTGINDVLGAQGDELAVRGPRDLYNLWYELPLAERGSDTYRGEWGTLMHLIISRGLYDYRGVQYVDNSFGVGRFIGLNADAKGLPDRWRFDPPAGAGFSDHFPVYAKFITVKDGRADRYLALKNPGVEDAGKVERVKVDFARVDLEKAALTAATLPPGANIRTPAFRGKIFRVEGVVAAGDRLGVEFRGETYDIWSYDEALRKQLAAAHRPGTPIKFYGELSQYKDRWQFVVQDPSWVR
jgi:hypothetical protein